jgi:hypothetical protein
MPDGENQYRPDPALVARFDQQMGEIETELGELCAYYLKVEDQFGESVAVSNVAGRLRDQMQFNPVGGNRVTAIAAMAIQKLAHSRAKE